MRNFLLVFCILHSAFFITSCSIPNLETPQCTEARDVVKRFYSFHFGNDMRPLSEDFKAQEIFLTSELIATLFSTDKEARDYFTATENHPKAFRVGECSAESDSKATLQVLLLWRDDTSSDQKEIHVETVLIGDRWLINKVAN
jgi:hypothetical protein